MSWISFSLVSAVTDALPSVQWEPVNRKRNALDRAIEALERDVPVSTGTAKSCGYCGEAVEEHWDYCPWCGQRRSKQ